MKKFSVLLVFCLILGVASLASAATYTEEYSAASGSNGQIVAPGGEYEFVFDIWYLNDLPGFEYTNSNLILTEDAFGAEGESWKSAALSVGFYSFDSLDEEATIVLTAYGARLDQTFDLGTFAFNGTLGDSFDTFTYDFTQEALLAFEVLGWGDVTISAEVITGTTNDFFITSVGLAVNTAPVPEPGTMLLLGSGILGLGLFRKLKN